MNRKDLVKKITEASQKYYGGEPIISDEEFDAKRRPPAHKDF